MNTNVTLRRAVIDDHSRVVAVVADAYAHYAGVIDGLPDVTAGLDDDIRDNIVWVAEVGDEIAGAMVLVSQDDVLKLANIAVYSDHQGIGAASQLLAKADEEARRIGLDRLVLATHLMMDGNVEYYLRKGWTITSRNDQKVSMEMRLNLAD